jgi:hypothetical protein
MSGAEREILLTLTDRQHAEFAEQIAELRKRTGAPSNTAAILDAVRRQAVTAGTADRKAPA